MGLVGKRMFKEILVQLCHVLVLMGEADLTVLV